MKFHYPGTKEKIFFLFSGAVMSTPFPILFESLISYFLFLDFSLFFASLISVSVIAPIFEEFAKAYPLFYRHGESQKSLMTLGFLTGLGFGIVEFFLYVVLLRVPVFIRLPALLFHATNTSIVGYGIGKGQTFLFYLLAVGLHFLNNFSTLFGYWWFIGGLSATLLSYILAWVFFARASEKTINNWAQV